MVLPVALELLRSAPTARRLRQEAKRLDALHQIVISATYSVAPARSRMCLRSGATTVPASPTDLVAAAAAESVEAELWHCDRHFELIAEVTGQPLRRLGE